MTDTNILIIGGGAAGLLAASRLSDKGFSVSVIERFNSCGRKIKITGKGRCNLTNNKAWKDFSEHIYPNSNFFKTAFYNFSNHDLMNYIEALGVPLKIERGERVYPQSDKSQDIVDALVNNCVNNAVVFYNQHICTDIELLENKRFSVYGYSNNSFSDAFNIKETDKIENLGNSFNFHADHILLATGGLSYFYIDKRLSGYNLAKNLGHKLIPRTPALTAIIPKWYEDDTRNKNEYSVLIKNIGLSLIIDGNIVQDEFGEINFTHDGLEGALGFKVSKKAVKAIDKKQKVEVEIDLKPSLSIEKLTAKLRKKLFKLNKANISSKDIVNLLNSFLPYDIVRLILSSEDKVEVNQIPLLLKKWRFPISSYIGYKRAVITSGGISLKDVSRKTMESKIIPGFYLAGEVLDLDADTGGYNLQVAFSTAALASDSIIEKLEEKYSIDLVKNKVN